MPIEKALAQTRHQLAVLAGRLPGDDGLPSFDLASLSLPRDLPIRMRAESSLAQRRTYFRG